MHATAPSHAPAPYPTEAELDAVLVEFGNDPRAAIKALLVDLDMLARDAEATTSRGFVRGGAPVPRQRRHTP